MQLSIGYPSLTVTLRRSARARRFSLRVGQADGRITLTLPLRAHQDEAVRFARAHEGWIRQTLAKVPQVPPLIYGAQIFLEGRALIITPQVVGAGAGHGLRLDGDHLIVPGAAAQVPARIAAYLKLLARDRLAQSSDYFATQIGRSVTRLTLRDTRSRWGSCSPQGALMFNWRLIMAPPAVLNYVAAHEVAHLVEMNHAPAFWAIVAQLYPDWRAQRAWLQRHGGALHAVRFAVAD